MIPVLTPAGAALCVALGVQSCNGLSLFLAATNPLAPAEYRYELLVGCTDEEEREHPTFCGKEMDCAVVGMYVKTDGTPGLDRLCRKRRGEPTS